MTLELSVLFSTKSSVFNVNFSFRSEEPRNRADVNVSLQPGGQTALHLAAERGNTAALLILLSQPDIEVQIVFLNIKIIIFPLV